MSDTVLTLSQIEDALYEAVVACLGLDPDSASAQGRVRRAWPETGTLPGFARADDLCFVRVGPCDDVYAGLCELQSAYDAQADALLASRERCEAHGVLLVFYGPHCLDDARRVRDGLARDEIRRILRLRGLYPFGVRGAPRRLPELFGGQWWDRCDFPFSLYERVRRENSADYYAAASAQTQEN